MIVLRVAAIFSALFFAFGTLSVSTSADSSGMLRLSGRIPAYYSIKLTPAHDSQLTDTGGLELGRLIEFRNGDGYYSIVVTSTNSGRLKNGAPVNDARTYENYELLFDSKPLDVRRGPASIHIDDRAEHTVKIKINPAHLSNELSDTLTFSIAVM